MVGRIMTILSFCDLKRMASLICRNWSIHIKTGIILQELPFTLVNIPLMRKGISLQLKNLPERQVALGGFMQNNRYGVPRRKAFLA